MLKPIILTIWMLLAPGAQRLPSASPIADAIVSATTDEREAALLALYAWRESSLRPEVTGGGGRSCGPWQMRCSAVRGLSLGAQARLWLSWVHASSLGSVDSSPARAAKRERLAASLLERAKR